MCEDLSVGDVVVFVGMDKDEHGSNAVTPPKSVLGRNWVVCDVQVYPSGRLGVLVSDYPIRPQTAAHWDARAFRRVYRPKADLISKLLEPVDLFSEAKQ